MTKKFLVVTISIVVVLLVLSVNSKAQSGNNNPCLLSFDAWDLYIIPEGATCIYQPTFIFALPCTIPNSTCKPPCIDCILKQLAGNAGEPINLASGSTFIQQSDIRVPGLGGGLSLVRTWSSVWPSSLSPFQVGIFGPNWRSTYEERVFLGVDNYIKYSRGDGSLWSFGYSGSTYNVAAPANTFATLATGSAYWTLTFQNGEQRRFDNTSGNLTAIIDRNGNTTTIAYDSSGRLSTVTDPASRTLTFTYGSGTNLVSSVTSTVGISLSYSYDTSGRLNQVTEPDSTTVSFAYNSQSLITSVTDSNGKVLESHTYDSNSRGLTSARAGGVEALTISYPH